MLTCYALPFARSLPQGERNDQELAEFKTMLKEVNLLYLGTSVLILLGACGVGVEPLETMTAGLTDDGTRAVSRRLVVSVALLDVLRGVAGDADALE